MTIALNIVFAIIVFAGVVGMLAYSVTSSRTAVQRTRKAHPVTANNRAVARQLGYGALKSANG